MKVKLCSTFTIGQGTQLDAIAIEAMHYLAGVANKLILTCKNHDHAVEVFQREVSLFDSQLQVDFVDNHNEPINLSVTDEAMIRITRLPYYIQ